MKPPRLHFQASVSFWISLSSNIEHPGSNHQSYFTNFHLHILSRTGKYVTQKLYKKLCVCSKFNLHQWRLPKATALQLETHFWISPQSRNSLHLSTWALCKTCWDYVTGNLPHIFFLLEPPCPAICHTGQENNLFLGGMAPAWQGHWGQAQGREWAQEFSDVGSVWLVLNLSFLYLTLGKLISADTLRHKIVPNMDY